MGLAYQKMLSTVSMNHPKTEERITDAAEYFERHYGSRALVEPASAPWKALRARPEVALVLRNYKQAFLAKKQLEQGRAQEAYATARTAVTGRTATDAYPNWVLARAAFALGRSREGIEALRRAVTSSEPVPNVYEDLIVAHEGAGNLPAALEWTDQASKTFGGAPRWMPHKIRLLRKTGRVAEANTVTIDCSLNATDWKRLCQEANATPAGRTGAPPSLVSRRGPAPSRRDRWPGGRAGAGPSRSGSAAGAGCSARLRKAWSIRKPFPPFGEYQV